MRSSIVSGEANFSMAHTGLTVGVFTQPIVARNILQHKVNVLSAVSLVRSETSHNSIQ